MSYETRYAAAKQAQRDKLADSVDAVAWRLRDNTIRQQASAEQAERFPQITLENFREACDWFEARVKELHAEAGS